MKTFRAAVTRNLLRTVSLKAVSVIISVVRARTPAVVRLSCIAIPKSRKAAKAAPVITTVEMRAFSHQGRK